MYDWDVLKGKDITCTSKFFFQFLIAPNIVKYSTSYKSVLLKKKHVISTMYNKNHLWFYTFKKKEKKTPRDEDEKHGLQYMYMSSDPNLPNDFRTFVRAPVYYLF